MSSIKKRNSSIKRKSFQKRKFNIFSQGDKDLKIVNNVRTKLLLFMDEENSKYIKTCNVKINHEMPKEIVKKYEVWNTVSFNNPIVHSCNSEIEQLSHRSQKGENDTKNEMKMNTPRKECEDNCSQNNDENPSNKSSKALGYFYFTKCLKEIGKDFIDQRKRNVSDKKLEKDGISSKRPSGLQIDTELSFIEVIQSFSSNKNNKSSSKSTNKRFSGFKNKTSKYSNLFGCKEEKEARNIQFNFDKLQFIVKTIKKIDSIKSDKTNFYANFKNNYDPELFEILQYKGKNFNNFLNSNSLLPHHIFNSEFINKVLVIEEEDHNMQDTINHKKVKSYNPNDRSSLNLIDDKVRKNKTKSLNVVDQKNGKKSINATNCYNRETNENTQNNVSLYKDNKFFNCKNLRHFGNEEVREYTEDEYTGNEDNTPSRKRDSNMVSDRDFLEYLNDHDFGWENRIETEPFWQTYSKDRLGSIRIHHSKNSDSNLVSLIKCKSNSNLVKNESENSRNSISDISRASIISKNKSDITMSSITEMSEDFYDKNL